MAGSWEGLLAGVRQAGDELIATVARMEPRHARVEVPTLVVDGDHILIDGPAQLEQLVTAPALAHLSGHAEQLKSYARRFSRR